MGGITRIFKSPKAPKAPEPQPLPEYTPPPEPEPEPAMPVPDDADTKIEKKKEFARRSKRSGRASTMFTSDDDGKLG